MNENENITFQSLLDTRKSVPRGKYIAVNACIKKKKEEFPFSSTVAIVVWVAFVVLIRSLARELPYATSAAKK